MMTIHAPCGNLVTITTTETTAVKTAPKPFMTARGSHPGTSARSRRQCTTMPACEMVKLVKTPTA